MDELKRLTFRPSEEEADFITEHNIQWSEHCHNTLQQIMEGKKQEKTKNKLQVLSQGILFLFLGIIFCVTAYNTPTFLAWAVMMLMGVGLTIFGILTVYWELQTYGNK